MKRVRSVFSDIHNSEEFQFESAKIAFAMELKRSMDATGINNTQLAQKLGVSKPMITKLLRGDANVTIETMVKASMALDGKLVLKIEGDSPAPRKMASATEKAIAAGSAMRPWRTVLAEVTLDSWSIPMSAWQDNNEAQSVAA